MRNRLSQDGIRNEYELHTEVEDWEINEGLREKPCLRTDFRTGKEFVNRVVMERRLIIKRQGWVEAIIVNRFGIEQTGVFVPIMTLLQRVVENAGGNESIMDYREHRSERDERTYSCAIDSDTFREE